jgi:nitrate reductase beta subunit
MKIRAQVAMVLNLDKCIGCHTCSVTSNRDEYVIVRKMKKIAWLEGPLNEGEGAAS